MKMPFRSFGFSLFLCASTLLSACSKPVEPTSDSSSSLRTGQVTRAVLRGSMLELEEALNKGGDPNENVGDPDHPISPLLVATATGRADMVRFLVNRGASKDIRFHGYALKDIAFLRDHAFVLEALR